ncbi:MAG TPA: 2-phospho-L-lactate transferase CofD family protein, partial [Thermomicrobiaceae bacterium]|nr:2-phospho-L-lactate transferase CofD family protein [Thermomicrobiaceae bacterium]
TGWGLAAETFSGLDMLALYGHDTWFRLGDRDFATHILRSERLRAGASLSQVTAELTAALGIMARVMPMCDEPVATTVETSDGALDFQDYFVRRGQADDVRGVRFDGIERATLTPSVGDALDSAGAVILCPSNPIVSIGPILAVPGLREQLRSLTAPIVAVSPIVGGKALKGPADRMLASLGHEVSAFGVAALYGDFLDGIVIDEEDRALAKRIEELGIVTVVTNTIMRTDDDRRELAAATLDFAAVLAESGRLR